MREHGYEVTVRWTDATADGTTSYRDYDRTHEISAAGKPTITASADPAFRGRAELWNPEDLLVAALSQCHMLSYLARCALDKVVVVDYQDTATGTMAESAGAGRFTEVVLHPVVTVTDPAMVQKATELHEAAHEACFIANSVNFPVRHQPIVQVREDRA